MEEQKGAGRYFIYGMQNKYDLIQLIKNDEIERNVITVIIYNGPEIKSFIWFLLQYDIQFKRIAAGAGIAIFHVDFTLNYFMKPKRERSNVKKAKKK